MDSLYGPMSWLRRTGKRVISRPRCWNARRPTFRLARPIDPRCWRACWTGLSAGMPARNRRSPLRHPIPAPVAAAFTDAPPSTPHAGIIRQTARRRTRCRRSGTRHHPSSTSNPPAAATATTSPMPATCRTMTARCRTGSARGLSQRDAPAARRRTRAAARRACGRLAWPGRAQARWPATSMAACRSTASTRRPMPVGVRGGLARRRAAGLARLALVRRTAGGQGRDRRRARSGGPLPPAQVAADRTQYPKHFRIATAMMKAPATVAGSRMPAGWHASGRLRQYQPRRRLCRTRDGPGRQTSAPAPRGDGLLDRIRGR